MTQHAREQAENATSQNDTGQNDTRQNDTRQNDTSELRLSAQRWTQAPATAEEAQELSGLLRQLSAAYAEGDSPLSDQEYDHLVRLAQAASAGGVPVEALDDIGAPAMFAPVRHRTPMQSLDNAMNEDEWREFVVSAGRALGMRSEDLGTLQWRGELKVDGLSIALRYEGGQLQQAATRGNGSVGEDVTHNVTLSRVPQQIPFTGTAEVRGEIYLDRQELARYNEEMTHEGGEVLRNARNGAAGALRKKTPDPRRLSRLRLMAYAAEVDGQTFSTQGERLKWLAAQGFETDPESQVLTGADAAWAWFSEVSSRRAQLPMDNDGVVMKLESLSLQAEAGAHRRAPRHSVAIKFPQEVKATRLAGVDFSVGRTGRVTPVALLEPVDLEGATVTKATLNNEDFLLSLDLHYGDTVMVRRSGGVIPEIMNAQRSEGSGQAVTYPAHCPECSAELVREAGRAGTFCLNEQCPSRGPALLTYLGRREVLDIGGLGEQVAQALFDAGVRDLAGLLDLTGRAEWLGELKLRDGERELSFGNKRARSLIKNIEAAKTPEWWRLIRALNVTGTGEGTATRLARTYGSPEALLGATEEDFARITDIGPKTARSLAAELSEGGRARATLTAALERGVRPVIETSEHAQALQGLSLVVTGSFEFSRSELEDHLKKCGAKVSGSVSAKTTALVQGEGGGSKAQKAAEKGIPTWSPERLRQEVESRGVPWFF